MSRAPDGEVWEFPPGSRVYREERDFADGHAGQLLAIRAVD